METQKIRIVRDKKLDLLTAYLEEKNEVALEALEQDNIIFFVDKTNKKLVMIQVYNFNAFQREMFKNLMIVVTKKAIEKLIELIADTFRTSNSLKPKLTG